MTDYEQLRLAKEDPPPKPTPPKTYYCEVCGEEVDTQHIGWVAYKGKTWHSHCWRREEVDK